MISLETKEFQGNNYCIVRTWDGYDKPEYFKQFEINKKEIDFKGGRFKKMKHIRGGYLNPFKIPTNIIQLREIVEWLDNNITKSFYISIEDNIELNWLIYITESDASWFGLKWGECLV